MKRSIFLALLFISTISYSQNNKSFVLEIELEGFTFDSIRYYLSNNGVSASPLLPWNSIPLENQTKAIIEREIQGVNLVEVLANNDSVYKSATIIVYPGGKYRVKLVNYSDRPVFQGDNAAGNEALSNLSTPFLCRGFSQEYIQDSTKQRLVSLMQENINKDLEPFNKLLSSGKIEQRFYDVMKTLIGTNHCYRLIKTIRHRHRLGHSPPSDYKTQMLQWMTPLDMYKDGFLQSIDSLFHTYPYTKEGALLSQRSQDYLECYLYHLSFKDSTECNEFDKDCLIGIAKENLTDEYYELSFANTFSYFNMEHDIPSVENRYNLFAKNFPNSIYLPEIKRLTDMEINIKKTGIGKPK